MKYKYIIGLVLCVALVSYIVFDRISAQTQGEYSLNGYAWSSNIGWIQFDNSNVKVNEDNTVTGYAWSSNIGWIQFGGLSNFPAGGAEQSNAKISNGKLVGWAKFLNAESGWDGWVSLGGDGYSIPLNNNNFSGYAWGDDVVGWINFSGVYLDEVSSGFAVSCSASPSSITIPQGGTSAQTTFLYTSSSPVNEQHWVYNGSVVSTNEEYVKNINSTGQYQYTVPVTVYATSTSSEQDSDICSVSVIDENYCEDGTSRPVSGVCAQNIQPPTINTFNFNPSITNTNGTCPLVLEVENVSSCVLKNRIGQNAGNIITSSDAPLYKISSNQIETYNIGTYSLYCAPVDNPTVYQSMGVGTRSCTSNSDIREN